MAEEESISDMRWNLRRSPTAAAWEEELRRLVLGHRDDFREHLGSAGAYVKSLIVISEQRAKAETAAFTALRRVVETWRPWPSSGSGENLRLLELLEAFSPETGLPKVLHLLSATIDLLEAPESRDVIALCSASLKVLERYFPFEGPPQLAFKAYISRLRQLTQSPDYGVYATSRLRRLGVVETRSEGVTTLLLQKPECLDDLVSIFCATIPMEDEDVEHLAGIYCQCLALGGEYRRKFRGAIGRSGLRLRDSRGSGPILSAERSGWTRRLLTQPADQLLYLKQDFVPLVDESLSGTVEAMRQKIAREGLGISSYSLVSN